MSEPQYYFGFDPGYGQTGGCSLAAVDEKGHLQWAHYVRNGPILGGAAQALAAFPEPLELVHGLVCELPQIYAKDGAKSGTACINLAAQTGAMGVLAGAQINGNVYLMRPRDWTGGIPKGKRHKHLVLELTEMELAALDLAYDGCPKGQRHNILDAVGLAKVCWELEKEAV